MGTWGIHVIWTTYMTWPPGDPRGHWSPLFDFYGRLTAAGGQLRMADAATLGRAAALAKEPPRILSQDEIRVVADTIGQIVRDPQAQAGALHPLRIAAATVEPTHVHLRLAPLDEDLDRVVGRLKGRSSSEVLKLSPGAHRRRTWTSGFWKVFLFDAAALTAVDAYIQAHNQRRGLPASPYPWITPT